MDRATLYAESVVGGKVVAGKPHIQACQRHLSNLAAQGTKDFPFVWRPEKSEEILDFAETLTIAEGEKPRPLVLYGFQHFDLGVPFGWYNDRGYRRFRRSYKSKARQNGKTFENGIQGTYIAGFGGYNYGKLFTAATKWAQAKLAWEEIMKFVLIDSDLSELFKVQEYKTLITALGTNSTIEALSKDRSLDEGFRAIYNSIDEIHQHRDNSIYKALYNGTRSLNETLNSMTTTRGRNLNSFCYEMDAYCLNILNGSVSAEDFFVDIYTLDDGDDPFDEKNWIKSNPLLARTEQGMKTLRTDAQTAKDMGGMELADYLTKCMNMWVQKTDNQYIDVEAFRKCKSKRTLESFKGYPCYVGLDLSSGGDLVTLNIEIPFTEMGRQKYYFYSHSFMPRGRLMEHILTDIAPYDIWEKEELITVTGGKMDFKNDYKFIIKHLKELQEQFDLNYTGIGYDPHNADGFLSDLEDFGCPLTMITQSARFLNDATVDLQLLIRNGDFEYHEGSSLFIWSFINAKITSNSFGEIKVDKEPNARTRRIDPVDAAIDSHVLCMKREEGVDIKGEMENYLKRMGWA
ncbi:MAG: terminase large subunit [Eubacteriales bacterium]|nr:terminase large subunit [Eubacteriales bacterium]MDD4390309.1 terminase large subunit [Eubacteriales bacterium]